jgi:RimJ/RimL family protein N-acetyltransferase
VSLVSRLTPLNSQIQFYSIQYMKASPDLCFGDIQLTPVSLEDAEFILSLRSDPELNRHLSTTSQDVEAQRQWIREYKQRQAASTEYYFIISKSGEKLGTIRAYDFRDDSFCWGSWIILRGTSPQVAIASVLMIYDFSFDQLGFTKSHFDVRRDNESVRRFHLRMGAKIVRSDEGNEYFELLEDAYRQYRPKLVQLAGGLK